MTNNFNNWFARVTVINFVILSLWGVLLRLLQLSDLPLNYQFILHAHSHFAFAGWMFCTIAFLLTRLVSDGEISRPFKLLLYLSLISAYGMLVSFSLQGYRPAAIAFSTLFMGITFRFTYLLTKSVSLKNRVNPLAYPLIRGSLFFLCLSALGPLSLGPLAALGLKNTPAYTDAIYFYLHFQLNGFMLLGALGLLAAGLPITRLRSYDRVWLGLLIWSSLPLYLLFVLWGKPLWGIYGIAMGGAALNLLGWLGLCFRYRNFFDRFSLLEKAALLALTFKVIFQVLACIPEIGDWVFLSRNLVIGYIHLLTLGILMPLLLSRLFKANLARPIIGFPAFTFTYLAVVVTYLCLLFLQPMLALLGMIIPSFQWLLFLGSTALVGTGFLLAGKIKSADSPKM